MLLWQPDIMNGADCLSWMIIEAINIRQLHTHTHTRTHAHTAMSAGVIYSAVFVLCLCRKNKQNSLGHIILSHIHQITIHLRVIASYNLLNCHKINLFIQRSIVINTFPVNYFCHYVRINYY